ncbi:MAG: recombination protein O N-terminal domain-containing protein [Lentisphaeria bacterium]|nr:recombination protein O N-terminal domain-containing protein [Lentisphaeria bacterium]
MSAGSFKTRYMILRKTPFRDTSLVVAGISEDHGRLDFVLKGARAIGKKQFPTADVFREFQIEFRPSRRPESMPTLVSMDLVAAHDGIAQSMDCYLAACSFAAETLRRAQPMLEMPLAWQAFSVMLTRMERTLSPIIPLMLARLAVLREHGMLSDVVPYPDLLAPLFRCAVDADAPWPEIDETALNRIDGWVETRCRMLAV